MKSIHNWLEEYGKSHQNKTNKIIHWICVPLIFWSIIALLSLIPSEILQFSSNSSINEFAHWGTIVIIFGLIFYLRLSFNIFIGMLLLSSYVLIDIYYTVYLFELHKFWGLLKNCDGSGDIFLLYSSIIVFITAWIMQFIGHKIEGKKPSFLKDIQFLLIGPAWLLSFIYKKLNIKY